MAKKLTKELKETGKIKVGSPDVKERKPFAKKTKSETPKKGKGSYDRKNVEEDEQELGEVPLKREPKPKNKIQQMDDKLKKVKLSKENTNIRKFFESLISKNYSDADKYMKQAVECKIQSKIEKELTKNLF